MTNVAPIVRNRRCFNRRNSRPCLSKHDDAFGRWWKIIDYTAGGRLLHHCNDAAPSMFNGTLKEAIAETFDRFKFGGVTPQKNNKFLYQSPRNKGNQIRYKRAVELL